MENKTCTKCGLTQDVGQFYNQPAGKLGKMANCKTCHKAAHLKWRTANPEKWKAAHGKANKDYSIRQYGISPKERADMERNQRGRCAICDTETAKLDIDHDHGTLKVRALLCRPCNKGLGHFMDDPAILLQAASYLVKHGKKV